MDCCSLSDGLRDKTELFLLFTRVKEKRRHSGLRIKTCYKQICPNSLLDHKSSQRDELAFFRANTAYEPSASGDYTKWLLLEAS